VLNSSCRPEQCHKHAPFHRPASPRRTVRRLLKYIGYRQVVIVISVVQFQIILFGFTATIVVVFATLLGAQLFYIPMECIG
jgi:hypothetical protein